MVDLQLDISQCTLDTLRLLVQCAEIGSCFLPLSNGRFDANVTPSMSVVGLAINSCLRL